MSKLNIYIHNLGGYSKHICSKVTPHTVLKGCLIKTRDPGNRETNREKMEFQNINDKKNPSRIIVLQQ